MNDPAPLVLIVDDDESIREFIAMALEDEGYRTATATNGQVALEVMRHAPPDVILLDMRMPVMDGWEFARAYRAQIASSAPIIVMTAALDAAVSSAEIDAQGYLAKPFALDDLIALVRSFAGGA